MRKNKAMRFHKVYRSDFPKIIQIIKSSYLTNYPDGAIPKEMSVNLESPPFMWYFDPNLYWSIGKIDGRAIAFSLSRHVGRNYHLHSFHVDSRFQGLDYGKQLLFNHWAQGFQINPNLDTFTLHVYRKNISARSFYERWEYSVVDQTNIDLEEDGGLRDWARNCKKYGDWPLRKSLLLYMIKAKYVRSQNIKTFDACE